MTEPVTITLNDTDPELSALSHCACILEQFDDATRERMLNYLCERFPKVRTAMDKSERGRQDGHARAAALSPEQRSEQASHAANARWNGA